MRRAMSTAISRTIDLRKGHPSERNLPHAALAAASRAAADRCALGERGLPLQYASNTLGTPNFRAELSAFLSREYGSPVPAASLFTTNGVSHGLELACGALARPSDVVLCEEPTYFLAHQIFKDHGLKIVGVESDRDGLRTDILAAKLADGSLPKPKLLYLVPTHGNPSGASLPAERRRQLVALAEEHDFVVLADDVYQLLDWRADKLPRLLSYDTAYRERCASAGDGGERDDDAAAYDPSQTPPSGAGEKSGSDGHVVSVGSFTKILSPGLRLGWLEAAPSLLARVAERGYLVSGGGVAPFVSEVVAEVLSSGAQNEVLDSLCADYAAKSSALVDALHAEGLFEVEAPPDGGYFMWVKLPDGVSADALLPVAEAHGVVFLPGTRCGYEAQFGGHARLCFAMEERDLLVEGAKRLGAATRELLAAK